MVIYMNNYIVGAPTFPFARQKRQSKKRSRKAGPPTTQDGGAQEKAPARRGERPLQRRKSGPPPSCAMGNCCPTSRTSSIVYHYITYQCRRADNFGVRRLAAALRLTQWRHMNCLREKDGIGKAGASSRTPKSPWMEEPMSEEGQKENREKDR